MEFPLTIDSQEEFDRLIPDRLARARAQWESESGIAEARDKAREAESRAQAAEAKGRGRVLERDARRILEDMGVTERSRQEKILRLADFDNVGDDESGEPKAKDIRTAIKGVHRDLPEVFGDGARVTDAAADAGESNGGGSARGEVPITSEAQLASMSPQEINSNWDRVKAFLSGER